MAIHNTNLTAPMPGALLIRTPEGVGFTLRLASPVLRGIAVFIDAMLVTTLSQTSIAAAKLLQWLSADFAFAMAILAYFLISFAYAMTLEWRWNGQTVGKRLLRLRVVDARGLRLTFAQVVVRNLMRVIDSLPALYAVGGLAALISPHRQRLGDLAADTVVVITAPPTVPDASSMTAGRWNSFRDHPRLEARLRQSVTPAEATLLFQALARREALAPAARLSLYHEMAATLRQRVPFPAEVDEDLADEHYLRNVLDSLFR